MSSFANVKMNCTSVSILCWALTMVFVLGYMSPTRAAMKRDDVGYSILEKGDYEMYFFSDDSIGRQAVSNYCSQHRDHAILCVGSEMTAKNVQPHSIKTCSLLLSQAEKSMELQTRRHDIERDDYHLEDYIVDFGYKGMRHLVRQLTFCLDAKEKVLSIALLNPFGSRGCMVCRKRAFMDDAFLGAKYLTQTYTVYQKYRHSFVGDVLEFEPKDFFRYALRPFYELVNNVWGTNFGRPHAVVIQSSFWDLGRKKNCENTPGYGVYCPGSSKALEVYLSGWAVNATKYAGFVIQEFSNPHQALNISSFPSYSAEHNGTSLNPVLFFWRSANMVNTGNIDNHWTSHNCTNELLQGMNRASRLFVLGTRASGHRESSSLRSERSISSPKPAYYIDFEHFYLSYAESLVGWSPKSQASWDEALWGESPTLYHLSAQGGDFTQRNMSKSVFAELMSDYVHPGRMWTSELLTMVTLKAKQVMRNDSRFSNYPLRFALHLNA